MGKSGDMSSHWFPPRILARAQHSIDLNAFVHGLEPSTFGFAGADSLRLEFGASDCRVALTL